MEKSNRVDRARQFASFSALRGFEDMVREQNLQASPKKELSEQDAARLNRIVHRLEKGSMITVRYYAGKGYTTLQGMVSEIDLTMRTLTVVKKKIPLDDVSHIEIHPSHNECN